MPSTGMVADCRNDGDCRVGYYYGGPEQATWLALPAGMTTMPKPDVIWHSATFAEARLGCGQGCTWSYFFEAEGRSLAVRQIFTAREALRIERDWAPGLTVGEAITEIRFDPDGRLSLTWLKGPDRVPVRERVTVPSFAR
jgi:hypothetical protein